MTYDVRVKELSAQPIVSIRATIPNDEIMSFYNEAQDEIHSYLENLNVAVAGPRMSLWHGSPQDSPTHTDDTTKRPARV